VPITLSSAGFEHGWPAPSSGRRYRVALRISGINPADESVIGTVPTATPGRPRCRAERAEEGFKVWSKTSPAKRAEIILKAVALMRPAREDLAYAMTVEQGKPIAQSRLEIIRGCEIIEWDAQEGRRVYGRVIRASPASATPCCASRSASWPRSRRGISR